MIWQAVARDNMCLAPGAHVRGNSAGRCAGTKALSTMKSLKAGLSNVKAASFNAYKAANEAVRPAQKESSFKADGVRVLLCQKLLLNCRSARSPLRDFEHHCVQRLTPSEFVIAGDFLVRTYPTWSW